MFNIRRAVNGITINKEDYILDDDGKVRLFDSEDAAVLFLNEGTDSANTLEQWNDLGVYICVEDM